MLEACHIFDGNGYVKICQMRISILSMEELVEYSSSKSKSAQSRKVFQLERVKIIIIKLKWNTQGKGMILIGFLFYRSHGVSGRPGYRIDGVLSRGALK